MRSFQRSRVLLQQYASSLRPYAHPVSVCPSEGKLFNLLLCLNTTNAYVDSSYITRSLSNRLGSVVSSTLLSTLLCHETLSSSPKLAI